MEKPVPWRNRFPGETGSQEKPVPWRNGFHGETGSMEKPVSWRNRFHGETGSMEKLFPGRNWFVPDRYFDISVGKFGLPFKTCSFVSMLSCQIYCYRENQRKLFTRFSMM